VESWIAAEGSFGGNGMFSNNPLNVTANNVKASIAAGFLPSDFKYSIPNPDQNGKNPVVQFPDLTSGVIANIAGLRQQFATGIRALLSKPGIITTPSLSAAVSASHWGTDPFGNTPPSTATATGDPTSGSGIGVTGSGSTVTGNSPGDACAGLGGFDLIGCRMDQFTTYFGGIATFLTTSSNWWRLGLSVVGGGMVVAGLVIYVKPHLEAPR